MLVHKHPHKMQTLFSPSWNVFETVWVHFGIEMDRLDPQLAPLGISQLWHRTVEEIEKKGRARKKSSVRRGAAPLDPPVWRLIKILRHQESAPLIRWRLN